MKIYLSISCLNCHKQAKAYSKSTIIPNRNNNEIIGKNPIVLYSVWILFTKLVTRVCLFSNGGDYV